MEDAPISMRLKPVQNDQVDVSISQARCPFWPNEWNLKMDNQKVHTHELPLLRSLNLQRIFVQRFLRNM